MKASQKEKHGKPCNERLLRGAKARHTRKEKQLAAFRWQNVARPRGGREHAPAQRDELLVAVLLLARDELRRDFPVVDLLRLDFGAFIPRTSPVFKICQKFVKFLSKFRQILAKIS